jgi:uncharacterized SAM-binding protein YcdF (DUF218 family)
VFYVLSKTLDVLLGPLTWAIALAFASLVRSKAWCRWAGPGAGVLLCLFSSERVSNALVRHLEEASKPTMKTGVTYDAAILLGGVVEHRETATWGAVAYNDNVERLLVTYDLLKSGRCHDVIISGGAEAGDPVHEALVLGKQLEDWGVEPSRIVLDDHALNTRENAVESARLAHEHGYRTLLLVTSAFHMPRALDCFRAVGLDVDALPVDYKSFDPNRASAELLPRAGPLKDSTMALREFAGRWIYRVTGRGR